MSPARSRGALRSLKSSYSADRLSRSRIQGRGPIAVTCVTYSPDLAQWNCLVLPVVVDAEDALIAALKVKMQRPEALIA